MSEKLYWARKIATEGQYGHFVKAEKSEEQMARSPVQVDDVSTSGLALRHQTGILDSTAQLAEYLLSGGLTMHWNHCEQLLDHFKIVVDTMDIYCELHSVSVVRALIKSD